jgi:lipopolysaccharide transport system ATP-binding protein
VRAENAVQVEGASKKYCKRLRRSMLYGIQDIARNAVGIGSRSGGLRKGEFWALDDVSFDLPRGSTLGIIGPNGSGKTTLLKLLSGIFWPDRGRVAIRGRVGALIEVGAGFHPLLTGRENIYLNGAILGMTRDEIARRFDAIVEFADIGEFLDAPVKHYSSGMFVRLGFSVAVHATPDVLLVDEVLAVGDKAFTLKCYRRFHEIKKRGTTVLLVSHNEYTIREQTETCLYLRGGRTRFLGPSEDAISLYVRDTYEERPRPEAAGPAPGGDARKAQIRALRFLDGDARDVSAVDSGQELTIVLDCVVHAPLRRPVFSVNFYDQGGFMYCANSQYEEVCFPDLARGRVRVRIRIPQFHLPTNRYVCSAIVAEETISNVVDWQDMAYTLLVGRARNARGAVKLSTEWSLEGADGAGQSA